MTSVSAGGRNWSGPYGRRLVSSDVYATLYREYRLLTRNRTNLLLSVIPTAVYILLFATSLNKLIGSVAYADRAVPYPQFALPAMLLSATLSAATTTGMSLFQERLSRMEIELWSFPLRRSSYIAGKLLAAAVLVILQSIAALLLALALFRFDWTAGQWTAMMVATVLAAIAFNGAYLLLATVFSDFQRFTVTINVLTPIMLFASPSFYPPQEMPALLRWLSWADPVTYGIDAIRDVTLLGLSAAWPWLAALAGMSAVTVPLVASFMARASRRI
jgi:ABC-2 type transport system permease protein